MENTYEQRMSDEKWFKLGFEEFDESHMVDELEEKTRPKTYYAKYKSFKQGINLLSYFFNIISALTIGAAAFFVTQFMVGMVWLAWILAIVAIVAVEAVKRKSSSEFWQIWFFRRRIDGGWATLSIFILLVSLAASGYGTKKGGNELAPDPELLAADSLAQTYRKEIALLEAKNADLRANKDHTGTTFYKLSDGINANELLIAEYRRKLLSKDEKLEGSNELLTANYQAEVENTTWFMVGCVIASEIFFECCVAYIWLFMFRSYAEKLFAEGRIDTIADIYNNRIRPKKQPTVPGAKEVVEQVFQQSYKNNPIAVSNYQAPAVNRANVYQPPYSSAPIAQTDVAVENRKMAGFPVGDRKLKPVEPPLDNVQQSFLQNKYGHYGDGEIRSRVRQSWERMHTQDDTTTPKKNFKELCEEMTRRGYVRIVPHGYSQVHFKDKDGLWHPRSARKIYVEKEAK